MPDYNIGSDGADDYATIAIALGTPAVLAATGTVRLLLRNEVHTMGPSETVANGALACDSLHIIPQGGATQDHVLGSTAKPIIRAANGVTARQIIRFQDDGVNLLISDIEFDGNDAGTSGVHSSGLIALDCNSGVATHVVERCVFYRLNYSNSSMIQTYPGNPNAYIRNCVFYGPGTAGTGNNYTLYLRGNDTEVANCTLYVDKSQLQASGAFNAIQQAAGTGTTITNCLVLDEGTSPGQTYTVLNGSATNSNNYSSTTDAGFTDITVANAVQATSGADAFKIASGSVLIDGGADLSADFADDLTATTRSGWDVGAIAAVAADFSDTFTGTADTPIYDRDPDVGPRWLRS